MDATSSGDRRRAMQLHVALDWSQMYTNGPTRETVAGCATALELAESLGDTDYQLRALWGLWAGRMDSGEFRRALDLARRFHDLSRSAERGPGGPADWRPVACRIAALPR